MTGQETKRCGQCGIELGDEAECPQCNAVPAGNQPTEGNDAVIAEVVDAEPADDDIVMCEVVEVPRSQSAISQAPMSQPPISPAPGAANANPNSSAPRSPFAPNYQHDRRSKRDFGLDEKREYLSAKGGAVGAMTLGVLAVPGAVLTPASAVTALIGIGLGIWGLMSAHRRMAFIGMGLCVFALLLCLLRDLLGFSDWF